MTLMSTSGPIWNKLRTYEASGELRLLLPRSARESIQRPMYLLPDLYAQVNGFYSNAAEQDRYSSLLADLEVFVTGGTLTTSYLRQLRPRSKRVWDIRSKRPRPSVRIFGLFACPDVFVATNLHLRSALGPAGTPQWKEAIRQSRFHWNKLFPEFEPAEGDLSQLVSGEIVNV